MPTCVQCSADAAPGSIRCAPHRDAQRERNRLWMRAHRLSTRSVDTNVDIPHDSDMSRYSASVGLSQSMACEHHCTSCRLDRIEELLVAILSKTDNERERENAHYRHILERLTTMANAIDTLRDALRDNTNAVSARIDALIAQIQTSGDNTATPETLADLQVISDHLKALGTDPNNPVPQLAPRQQ